MTKQIPLTQGKFALVDDDLFDHLNQWKWQANYSRGKWYAVRQEGYPKQRNVWMHRVIAGVSDPQTEIDHKDGDGLHNFRSNLRTCNRTQNNRNATKRKDNASGFKGVSWHKQSQKYQARIRVNGGLIALGLYAESEEAARAYDKAAVEHFGEFAHLNFPK